MKIIHLGQAHRLPFDLPASKEYITLAVESQIKIAQYILAHPGIPVFHEGIEENWIDHARNEMLAFSAKALFPGDFPSSASELSELQRGFLYECHAAGTL